MMSWPASSRFIVDLAVKVVAACIGLNELITVDIFFVVIFVDVASVAVVTVVITFVATISVVVIGHFVVLVTALLVVA